MCVLGVTKVLPIRRDSDASSFPTETGTEADLLKWPLTTQGDNSGRAAVRGLRTPKLQFPREHKIVSSEVRQVKGWDQDGVTC